MNPLPPLATVVDDPRPAVRLGGSGGPVGLATRAPSIDALRGVAVLGILLMNVVGFGLPFAAYDDPSIIGNRSPIDYWVWAVSEVLADGKFRAMLSMLFGASVVLMASRAERCGASDSGDVHLRRHLWLLVFGAVHAYLLIWPGDILFTYAAAGLPLFVFRGLRPRSLIVLGTLVLALQAPKTAFEDAELADAVRTLHTLEIESAAIGAYTPAQDRARAVALDTLAEDKPSPATISEAIAAHRGGYLGNVADKAEANLYLESMFLYKFGFWDAIGPMLIGMGLLKLGVFSATRPRGFYLRLAAIGYGIGLPLNAWMVADWTRHGFEAGARWRSFDDLARMSVAFGHVALVVLVCSSPAGTRLLRPVIEAGRMALTNYMMQTVICVVLFSGVGLGWFGALARHQLYFVVVAVWALQLIVSPLWLRVFRFGPLEWLWRSLTYATRQPFRTGM